RRPAASRDRRARTVQPCSREARGRGAAAPPITGIGPQSERADVTSPTRLGIAIGALALLLSGVTTWGQSIPTSPTQPVSFDQFKAQQTQQLQRAQARVAQRLGSPDLPPDQRQKLERRQA